MLCHEAGRIRVAAAEQKMYKGGGTRRATADLNFSFVHHVECSTRTIEKSEREHRNLVIEVMT